MSQIDRVDALSLTLHTQKKKLKLETCMCYVQGTPAATAQIVNTNVNQNGECAFA
jgi:hypothetical protein